MKRKLCTVISVLLIASLLLSAVAIATDSELMLPEDVFPDDNFYRSVREGVRLGIVIGTSEGSFTFEPNRIVTRAEFITMLGRMHEYFNGPIGTSEEGLFYERYLNWAVENDIVRGNRCGDFLPHASLTREQMIVISHRYIVAFELWQTIVSNFRNSIPPDMALPLIQTYSDTDISYWADDSVITFAVIHQLPTTNLYFRPQDNATRSEALSTITNLTRWIFD